MLLQGSCPGLALFFSYLDLFSITPCAFHSEFYHLLQRAMSHINSGYVVSHSLHRVVKIVLGNIDQIQHPVSRNFAPATSHYAALSEHGTLYPLQFPLYTFLSSKPNISRFFAHDLISRAIFSNITLFYSVEWFSVEITNAFKSWSYPLQEKKKSFLEILFKLIPKVLFSVPIKLLSLTVSVTPTFHENPCFSHISLLA